MKRSHHKVGYVCRSRGTCDNRYECGHFPIHFPLSKTQSGQLLDNCFKMDWRACRTTCVKSSEYDWRDE